MNQNLTKSLPLSLNQIQQNFNKNLRLSAIQYVKKNKLNFINKEQSITFTKFHNQFDYFK